MGRGSLGLQFVFELFVVFHIRLDLFGQPFVLTMSGVLEVGKAHIRIMLLEPLSLPLIAFFSCPIESSDTIETLTGLFDLFTLLVLFFLAVQALFLSLPIRWQLGPSVFFYNFLAVQNPGLMLSKYIESE